MALWATAALPAGVPLPEIYPSTKTVPSNLLRMEVRFARPLHRDFAPGDLELLDSQGRPIPDALLDLMLPSRDGQRLAVLLHPARIKTGVGANTRLGAALHAGQIVTLQVRVPGTSVVTSRQWEVVEPDGTGPQPERWRVSIAGKAPRAALRVQLDAPISSTGESLIAVRAPDGSRVKGRSRLENGETIWTFVPDRPWGGGQHALVTPPELEDPAGNRTCAPFDAFRSSRLPCDAEATISFRPVN